MARHSAKILSSDPNVRALCVICLVSSDKPHAMASTQEQKYVWMPVLNEEGKTYYFNQVTPACRPQAFAAALEDAR